MGNFWVQILFLTSCYKSFGNKVLCKHLVEKKFIIHQYNCLFLNISLFLFRIYLSLYYSGTCCPLYLQHVSLTCMFCIQMMVWGMSEVIYTELQDTVTFRLEKTAERLKSKNPEQIWKKKDLLWGCGIPWCIVYQILIFSFAEIFF